MISAFSSSTLSAASFFSNYWWSALSAPDSTAVDAHSFAYDECAECCLPLWICTCQRGGDYE
jgi:hypothetical protein